MEWKKHGLIYKPDGFSSWAKTHAMIPTPMKLNNECIRVFVTFCDEDGIGRPGYVDISSKNPKKIMNVSKTPLFDVGRPGTFDENGIVTCSVVNVGGGKLYLYYVGFELGTKIRYRLLSGIAVSTDGGNSFKRCYEVPVLERSAAELYFRCGPFCIYENGLYKLWYVAGSEWLNIHDKEMPVYDIRYVESLDGINWPNRGEVQIPIKDKNEHGFGRPYVFRNKNGSYRMFYSIRKKALGSYRLGYAESDDGKNWLRLDEKLNLEVTADSFDSEAIMYAAPIELNGKLFVFYNGNNFGLDGFALAELKKE